MAACLVATPLVMSTSASAQTRPITPACPDSTPAADFADVPRSSTHAAAIDCVVYRQITAGVLPGYYQPDSLVTREQMATFVTRLLQRSGALLVPGTDAFVDVASSSHRESINRLANAGIIGGVGASRFNPTGTVTRAQMATFLVVAAEHHLGSSLPSGPDAFSDDSGSPHEANINKAAAAGLTGGTAPELYSPNSTLARAPMASFLARTYAMFAGVGAANGQVRRTAAQLPPASDVTFTVESGVADGFVVQIREGLAAGQALLGSAGPIQVFIWKNDAVGVDYLMRHIAAPESYRAQAEELVASADGFATSDAVFFPEADRPNVASVATHEYTHVHQLSLFDPGRHHLPWWMIEGTAMVVQYRMEDMFGSGTSTYEMLRRLSMPAALSYGQGLSSLESPETPSADSAGQFYGLAFLAGDLLADLAGPDVLLEDLWNNIDAFATWEQGFEATFNMSVPEFYAVFDAHVAQLDRVY